MKKTLALALAVLMVVAAFALFAVNVSADDEYFTYDEETDTLYVLKDTPDSCTYNGGEGIDTYPWAEYRQTVIEVVVGDEVTKLGHAAFSSSATLEKVTCGRKCSYIDMDAFAYNACLSELVFKCPVTFVGQGTVYQSTNLMSVTLTNQTKEAFLKIATKRPYNDAYDNDVSYEILEDPTLEEPEKPDYYKIDLKPYYGCIENWSGNTYFIAGGTDPDYCTRDLLAGVKDEEGNVVTPAQYKVKVVIVDETEGKTYTIPQYAFDNPNSEIYGDGSFLRIAACFYGIPVINGHKYTISLEFTDASGKVIAKGESAKGAFDHGNDAFVADGQIIPDPVPHTYAEAGGNVDPQPQPTGDNTAVIAVLAIVALLGTAVVVSKKVLSK